MLITELEINNETMELYTNTKKQVFLNVLYSNISFYVAFVPGSFPFNRPGDVVEWNTYFMNHRSDYTPDDVVRSVYAKLKRL